MKKSTKKQLSEVSEQLADAEVTVASAEKHVDMKKRELKRAMSEENQRAAAQVTAARKRMEKAKALAEARAVEAKETADYRAKKALETAADYTHASEVENQSANETAIPELASAASIMKQVNSNFKFRAHLMTDLDYDCLFPFWDKCCLS